MPGDFGATECVDPFSMRCTQYRDECSAAPARLDPSQGKTESTGGPQGMLALPARSVLSEVLLRVIALPWLQASAATLRRWKPVPIPARCLSASEPPAVHLRRRCPRCCKRRRWPHHPDRSRQLSASVRGVQVLRTSSCVLAAGDSALAGAGVGARGGAFPCPPPHPLPVNMRLPPLRLRRRCMRCYGCRRWRTRRRCRSTSSATPVCFCPPSCCPTPPAGTRPAAVWCCSGKECRNLTEGAFLT